MTSEKFIPNKTALITLIAASLVVIISLGIRQTFGLFFFDFEIDLGCTQTEFGFAMGIQLFFWGLFGPLFGIMIFDFYYIQKGKLDNKELAKWIRSELEFDQLILEFYRDNEPSSGWIHCSYSTNSNRNQSLRAMREDGKVVYKPLLEYDI